VVRKKIPCRVCGSLDTYAASGLDICPDCMGGVNSKGEEHAFRVLSYFARDWPVIADVRKTLEAYPSVSAGLQVDRVPA